MKTEAELLLNEAKKSTSESKTDKRMVAANLTDLVARLDGVSQTMEIYFGMLDGVAKDKANSLSPAEMKAVKSRISGTQKAVWTAISEAENLQEYFEREIL
jgi:hypothetical protein